MRAGPATQVGKNKSMEVLTSILTVEFHFTYLYKISLNAHFMVDIYFFFQLGETFIE